MADVAPLLLATNFSVASLIFKFTLSSLVDNMLPLVNYWLAKLECSSTLLTTKTWMIYIAMCMYMVCIQYDIIMLDKNKTHKST